MNTFYILLSVMHFELPNCVIRSKAFQLKCFKCIDYTKARAN